MKRAFVYRDEKSDKFWWIDYEGNDFVVNYGKNGTTGKYEIKESNSEQECNRQALNLINQKIKKGYKEVLDYDFANRYYFDDEEIGPHRKTSHPNYVEHFKEDFYFDCADEKAPFGSDEGSDSLSELVAHIKKYGNKNIPSLPQKIVEEFWDMEYMKPCNIDIDFIKAQIDNENEMLMVQSDQVIIAVALGQIKITGTVDEELKRLAFLSLKRLNIVSTILNWDFSGIIDIMIRDIHSFKV
ncbi:WGR domain-containing protein [Clostridium saccharoperbutylacetonicum]|uniref:WGR domain-containing protein n=1 Tax=Clostridium saccharoperbutylacetonicum TaxID=36745 RepID=UPI0039E8D737